MPKRKSDLDSAFGPSEPPPVAKKYKDDVPAHAEMAAILTQRSVVSDPLAQISKASVLSMTWEELQGWDSETNMGLFRIAFQSFLLQMCGGSPGEGAPDSATVFDRMPTMVEFLAHRNKMDAKAFKFSPQSSGAWPTVNAKYPGEANGKFVGPEEDGWRWGAGVHRKDDHLEHSFYPPKRLLPHVELWAAEKDVKLTRVGGLVRLSSPQCKNFCKDTREDFTLPGAGGG